MIEHCRLTAGNGVCLYCCSHLFLRRCVSRSLSEFVDILSCDFSSAGGCLQISLLPKGSARGGCRGMCQRLGKMHLELEGYEKIKLLYSRRAFTYLSDYMGFFYSHLLFYRYSLSREKRSDRILSYKHPTHGF